MKSTLTPKENKAWSRLAGGSFPDALEFDNAPGRRMDQLALCKVAIETGFPARGITQEHLDDEDGPEELFARVEAYRAGRI